MQMEKDVHIATDGMMQAMREMKGRIFGGENGGEKLASESPKNGCRYIAQDQAKLLPCQLPLPRLNQVLLHLNKVDSNSSTALLASPYLPNPASELQFAHVDFLPRPIMHLPLSHVYLQSYWDIIYSGKK